MQEIVLTNFYINKIIYIIVKKIYVIILFTILGFFVGYEVGQAIKETSYYAKTSFYMYKASTDVMISYENGDMSMPPSEFRKSWRYVNSFIEVLSLDIIYEKIKENTGIEYMPDEIAGMVSISQVEDTSIINAVVIGPSPQIAYLIANSMAYDIPKFVSEIIRIGTLVTYDYPVINYAPYTSTNTKKISILGIIGGFLLSFSWVFVRGLKNPIIRSDDEIESVTNHNVLIDVPKNKSLKKKRKSTDKNSKHCYQINDTYIKLYALLRKPKIIANSKIIAFSSSVSNSGKTRVCVDYAFLLEKIGHKVLVINIDPARVDRFSDLISSEKEETILREHISIKFLSVITKRKNLTAISVNDRIDDIEKSLTTQEFIDYIMQMGIEYDYILLNTPSLNISSIATLIIPNVGGCIIVARAGYSSMLNEIKLVKSFGEHNNSILGYVLTGTKNKSKGV